MKKSIEDRLADVELEVARLKLAIEAISDGMRETARELRRTAVRYATVRETVDS